MSHEYNRRIDHQKATLDFAEMERIVASWMIARPPVLIHNAGLAIMRDKNVPGEIDEARSEAVLRGTAEYTHRKEADEGTDILWFFLTMIFTHKLEIDYQDVRRQINGYGQRSDIFELMLMRTAELNPKNLQPEITQLLAIWASYTASMPEEYQPHKAILLTRDKDEANYPAEVYSATHPQEAYSLNKDELAVAYVHIRTALKKIRRKLKLAGFDSTYGMKREYWLPYKSYIMHFTESEKMLTALEIQLDLDYPTIGATHLLQ